MLCTVARFVKNKKNKWMNDFTKTRKKGRKLCKNIFALTLNFGFFWLMKLRFETMHWKLSEKSLWNLVCVQSVSDFWLPKSRGRQPALFASPLNLHWILFISTQNWTPKNGFRWRKWEKGYFFYLQLLFVYLPFTSLIYFFVGYYVF